MALVCMFSYAHAASLTKDGIERLVGDKYIVGEIQSDTPVYPLFTPNPAQPDAKPELAAYAFESNDFATVRGYSGKPINILIVLDLSGNFMFVKVLAHKEPLFFRPSDSARLSTFADQFKGLSLRHTLQLGKPSDTPSRSDQAAYLQGVHTGTISAKAISRTIMIAAANVATAKLKLDHIAVVEASPADIEVKTETPWEAPPELEDTPKKGVPAVPNSVADKAAPDTAADVADTVADNAPPPQPVQTVTIKAQSLANLQSDEADWITTWQARRTEIAILLAGLALLSIALFMQKRFSAHAKRLRVLRTLYLLFTLGFVGWFAQGQLTIVNITAALESLASGDDLSYLMNDPMTVILWLFVGATLLIWGRGTFCGWLCPFGALQELISLLTNAVGLRQRRVRAAIDAKLKWIKYGVLAVIIASLYIAPDFTSWAVEIEPFKTAISLHFMRSWPFVLWAVACLTLTVFIYRGYCRYICPLGAALASMNFLRRWSWIARRTECGTPCQSCRHRCEYQAIEPSGKINYSECFQCLDCVSIYQDEQRCLPLIQQKKKGRTVIAIQPAGVLS